MTGVALVIVMVSALAALPAHAANPTLSISPSTGLIDRQLLAIAGTGFTPGFEVRVSECLASDLSRCDPFTQSFHLPDASGNFAAPNYPLRREIHATVNSGVVTDCGSAAGVCVLAAVNIANPNQRASTPLVFDRRVPPLRYRPSVHPKVTLEQRGFVVGIRGTMHCTLAFPIGIVGFLGQDARDPNSGYPFFTSVNCAPPRTSWRTTIVVGPNDVPFLPGHGFVQVIALGATADPQVATLQTVTLVRAGVRS